MSPCGFDLYSLEAHDREHLFICSLAIGLSFSKKCLFKTFSYFLIELLLLLLICLSSLCILDTRFI